MISPNPGHNNALPSNSCTIWMQWSKAKEIPSQLKQSHLQGDSLPQNEGPSSLSPTEQDGIVPCHSNDTQRWLRPHQDFSRLHSKASFQLPQLGNHWPLLCFNFPMHKAGLQ